MLRPFAVVCLVILFSASAQLSGQSRKNERRSDSDYAMLQFKREITTEIRVRLLNDNGIFLVYEAERRTRDNERPRAPTPPIGMTWPPVICTCTVVLSTTASTLARR